MRPSIEAYIEYASSFFYIVFILKSAQRVILGIYDGTLKSRRNEIYWNVWIVLVLDFFPRPNSSELQSISPNKLEWSFKIQDFGLIESSPSMLIRVKRVCLLVINMIIPNCILSKCNVYYCIRCRNLSVIQTNIWI